MLGLHVNYETIMCKVCSISCVSGAIFNELKDERKNLKFATHFFHYAFDSRKALDPSQSICRRKGSREEGRE